ncbi:MULTISPECIES: glutamate racemase [Methylosinus]|uniref:Glutamate racemase n=1 Tax=Methylosinus trichosporium (strain ATCC 35070 / NCIMB 11131 / UNIQEM 75 / OB3b) TaxID=595536 RepID=A0A2D2D056_METT3|nr:MULTISPECIES: glutamate racemase [Methylosinus]ATQ68381.1 glutamate racemase [Methylosinus trichosporium OB3b]
MSSAPTISSAPKILVFDSGLGGLTVFVEVAKLRPHATLLYCADDAGFPYGPLSEEALVARVMLVMESLVAAHAPDLVVIACNTASTRVLPHLRARWPNLPFVGTVPAVKPAAERSRSRLISVLATPGTVTRDYTRALIASFAEGCEATLVGSSRLAPIAEDFLRGAAVSEAEIAAEIAPCFVQRPDGARTDVVVLACTHYPLLLDFFRRLAPWPVEWIDPAPAIARQADRLLLQRFGADRIGFREPPRAIFTSGARPVPPLAAALSRLGFAASPRNAPQG